jgi:hypothetical protein
MLQWGISFLNNRSVPIDSATNDLNHSDNEYILTNTRSDQMEYDNDPEVPNIGVV